MLTADRVRELLSYNPETGDFVWRVYRSGMAKAGYIAGSYATTGYRVICIDDKQYKAHRVAWLYMTGALPVNEIDHIDGDKTNNKFSNLRDVVARVNQENTKKAPKNNQTGFLGVAKVRNKWGARITAKKVMYYMGLFNSPEEAHAAYLKAKRILHEGCTI